LEIRLFKRSDTEQIARLFHDTVREVNVLDYTMEELEAWAPEDIHYKDWEAACIQKKTLVAEEQGILLGFIQLEEDGHIDCFYCHKDYQGIGIGTMLYNRLEAEARSQKLDRLYVEASITARPFFLKKGFIEIKKQKVAIRGVRLTNFLMEKKLVSKS
jgi:N-acetylglutamate synthase-like GNAT family acetyltransferase